MKILICYVAVSQGKITRDLAAKFAGTYLLAKPAIEHEIVIACNGGPLPLGVGLVFEGTGAKFFPRANDDGWDLSAYYDVAIKFPCDMLICMGESCYFVRPAWLDRLVYAWMCYGPGLYGTFTSFLVRPHINTTGFAVDPNLLLTYPRPRDKKERYAFEHGQNSFWRHVQKIGRPTKLVTWDGIYDPPEWRRPPNILCRGDQSNCLFRCSHTDRYAACSRDKRLSWERHADALTTAL